MLEDDNDVSTLSEGSRTGDTTDILDVAPNFHSQSSDVQIRNNMELGRLIDTINPDIMLADNNWIVLIAVLENGQRFEKGPPNCFERSLTF